MLKRCTRCKLEKERTEFNRNSHKKDGLQTFCRACSHLIFKRYWDDNKAYHKQQVALRNKRERKKANTIILERFKEVGGCFDCGTTDPCVLEFDHVRGEKKYNVGEVRNNSVKRLLEEMEKCDVVCANCHRRRSYQRMDNCYRLGSEV